MTEQKTNNHSFADIDQTRYDLKILQSLRRIIRSVDSHSHKLNAKHDITGPQLIALLAIVQYGSLTIASIAKEVYLSPSTLVGIVDRLVAKGYVERKRSQQDRRQVLVCVTEKGVQFSKSAPSPLQEKLAEALIGLTTLEQATISLSLERVVELMEAKEIDASPILETGDIVNTQ